MADETYWVSTGRVSVGNWDVALKTYVESANITRPQPDHKSLGLSNARTAYVQGDKVFYIICYCR